MEKSPKSEIFDIEMESRPLLAWTKFIKLGDFILLTPNLIEVQKQLPELVIVVPDLLWSLYREASVFESSIPVSKVESFLDSSEIEPLIFDLSIEKEVQVQVPDKPHESALAFLEPVHSILIYQKALREYFPDIKFDFTFKPFMDLSLDLQVLNNFSVTPFQYFTVHSQKFLSTKDSSFRSLENTVELIMERNPDLVCVNIVGPQENELFEDRKVSAQFKSIRADVREVGHLLTGSVFHLDLDTGIKNLAEALDVPTVELRASENDHNKIFQTSVKPLFLAESAQKILQAYSHIDT